MSKVKLVALLAIVLVVLLSVTYRISRSSGGDTDARRSATGESSSRNTRVRGHLGDDSMADAGGKNGRKGEKKSSGDKTKGRDGLTTASDAGSTGPEGMADSVPDTDTRDRLIYEEAQRRKFQPRKTDPDKVKPVELVGAVQLAATKQNVPPDLLAALMFCESEGSHRGAQPSIDAGFGVMNLRENNLVDTLGEAASLIGASKEDCIYNQALNLQAGAALLARYHDDALASGVSESEAWYMAICQYSGRQDPELASELADQVAAALMRGFKFDWGDGGGPYELPPNPNPVFAPKDPARVGLNPDGTVPTPAPDVSSPAPTL